MIVYADDAAACSCIAPGPPCQNAFQADAVFSGIVRSITVIPDDRPTEPGHVSLAAGPYQIQLTKVVELLGIQGAEVEITTAFDSSACGYTFERGQQYLVCVQGRQRIPLGLAMLAHAPAR